MAESPVLFPKNAAPGFLPDRVPNSAAFTAIQNGTSLIVQKNAPLPEVCIKCGKREGLTRKNQRFVWTPPWVFFTLLINALIFIILGSLMQKRGSLSIPLCADCRTRWSNATLASVAAGFGFLGLLVAAVALFVNNLPALGLASLAAMVALPIGVGVGYVRPRKLRPRRINDQTITLAGVHPDAALAIVGASQQPVLAAQSSSLADAPANPPAGSIGQ